MRSGWIVAIAILTGCLRFEVVAASPKHAHWHYMIGGRASAARVFAKQLHHESSAPGSLHLALAHVNAIDVQRLLVEIGDWVEATTAVSSTAEYALIAEPLATMRATSTGLGMLAAVLVERIAIELGDGHEVVATQSGGVADVIAAEAAELFHGLGEILVAHKAAERALGIPVPDEPAHAAQ